MRKEQITNKEGICILMLFILGSTLIVGIGGHAKNDAWIAGIIAIFMTIPIILVYGRILSIFPGKDLYEILETLLGKTFGKIISVVYIWYAFHLGALVIRNFGEFINDMTMPETPMILPTLYLGLVCISAVKSGIETIGRVCAYVIPFFIFVVIIVQLLGISVIHLRYLKPILGNELSLIAKGAFSAFSFPFAEAVLFIGVLSSLKSKKSYYKVYFAGLFFAGIIIVVITIRNIAILDGFVSKVYFPSHVAVSRIKIGTFIERMEVTVSAVFALGVFTKTSICLLVTCKGIEKIFNLKDYRSIVIQTGLLMVFFSNVIYKSIMEMEYWAFKIYEFYAFPFQVIIPILLLIMAEIKVRSRNKLENKSN